MICRIFDCFHSNIFFVGGIYFSMEEQILRRLKLKDKDEFKRILSLSKQYSRIVGGKQIKREPIEHSYVCIDLALETEGIQVIDKEILLKSSGTTKRCYLDSKKQYRSILGRSTPSSKKQKKSQDNEEEEDDLDNEGGDDENLPSHCINRKALKQKKYAQWKEDSISASIKLGNSNESNKRKKKQPMITMFMKPRNDEVEPIEDDHNHDDVDNYNDENNQL
eukprot:TRINITY_DN27575_c0_g2_i2.p2 TRINITY_DN27575_c0_g2~~TRINITY_DN27575_c0_g2_i2.p2  ORF type:complete len:221 (-),score=18.98 TRINITY_DN27575_c0_g2_i2:358-1020(-)